MNNILKALLIFIFLSNCSFNQNSKFWTSEKIQKLNKKDQSKGTLVEKCKRNIFLIKKCKQVREQKIEEINKKEEALNLEFNPRLKISLYSKPINNSFINNFDNNNGRVNYDGNLKKVSRYKFSKIDNFFQYSPEITFEKDNIIFFDNKGAILKFDRHSKLIWKKNYYSKSQKKQKPILFFANDNKTLFVADNIAKYYALDINTGELLWSKNNTAPFNSQIKISKDKFFIIDFENTLKAYSKKDGKEIWQIKTQNTLVRSQKKLSMVIVKDKIYFNNSLGDISAVDVQSGELIWQSPTQSSLLYHDSFFLKTSDIIADNNALYFSNNKNDFFSLDIVTGIINWQTKINSNLRPTLIDNYIFTISIEGFLIIIDKISGNIIRITDLFKKLNKKYLWEDKKLRDNITPVGFIIGKKDIYLSTSNGRLYLIDIATGQTKQVIKLDDEKISRPFVSNQSLYIIKDNAIIKLN